MLPGVPVPEINGSGIRIDVNIACIRAGRGGHPRGTDVGAAQDLAVALVGQVDRSLGVSRRSKQQQEGEYDEIFHGTWYFIKKLGGDHSKTLM